MTISKHAGGIRTHLCSDPNLFPTTAAGRKLADAFLEHGRHAEPILRKLHSEYGKFPLSEAGILIRIHARYDNARSPPDSLLVRDSGVSMNAEVVFDVFNYTGDGTSGYHYVPLVRSIPRPQASWS